MNSKTPVPHQEKLPRIRTLRDEKIDKAKTIITLKKIKAEVNPNLIQSWTNKLLN